MGIDIIGDAITLNLGIIKHILIPDQKINHFFMIFAQFEE